jgi:glycosyltransferase involved in cell wall biosynthesis
MLSARIAARLTSLVWGLLTRYGRIKYRYLLPVYRFLHLMPGDVRPQGTAVPTKTLRGAQALVRRLSRYGDEFYLEQLNSLIEVVRQSKGAVIFLPSVGWDIVNTQRTHHLAREFARQGFVSIVDTTNQYDDVNGLKQIEPNLFLSRVDSDMLARVPDPILWSFTYNFDRTDEYPQGTRTVYDWIDDIEVFPYDRAFLASNHERALKEATLVTCVAKSLLAQAVSVRSDAVYLPNAVDYLHFQSGKDEPPEDRVLENLRREGRPIAGYYGAMAEWFDYELLERVADMRPDWSFLLIGPMYDISLRERGREMLKRRNVHWIGARKYEEIPRYLSCFDVAMIPFVINDITIATSPLKLYEYFAGGKPVVTSRMPECEAFPEVVTADDEREFSAALDSARRRGADEAFQSRLRELAFENSWAARISEVVGHLGQPVSPGHSVIDTPYPQRLR